MRLFSADEHVNRLSPTPLLLICVLEARLSFYPKALIRLLTITFSVYMRVLQIHCSEFSYSIRKETPVAERPPQPEEDRLENVLVCLICFEKADEDRTNEIIDSFLENIRIDTTRLACKRLLLYPYAHLSKSLGSAKLAKEFLNKFRDCLAREGFEVHKSPFGWYKAFTLTCIGHPLAEAYREF